jgi:hypothetical protein
VGALQRHADEALIMTTSAEPFVAGPARPASPAVCAVECGAKCCRRPGGYGFFLTEDEGQRLLRLAGIRLIKLREVAERRDPEHRAGWALRFGEQPAGQCPFLDASNLCSIYEDRPAACREFPRAPTAGCLVWPPETLNRRTT